MIDAISRSAVLAGAEEIDWYHVNQNGKLVSGSTSDDVSYVKYDDVVHMLENAPALDVVPVVHAKWIEDGYRGIPCVCSHCGEEAHYTSTFREQFDYDWEENLVPCGYEEILEYIRSKCCPECGARMDGEAE